MRILIVEDEPDLAERIRAALTRHYSISLAGEGEEALERLLVEGYDLVILDIMLPKKDGFTVLYELRGQGMDIPVLLLTARGAVEDKIRGLDLGADDYLVKPFSMAELMARIRVQLRKRSGHVSPLLTAGPVSLDTVSKEIYLQGKKVDLTPKEFAILEFLLYNQNQALSRFTISEHVWGDAFDPFTMSNSIDVHIKNLRKKLGDSQGEFIVTVRGTGYMIKSTHDAGDNT